MSPVKSLGNSRAQYNYKFGLTGFEAAPPPPSGPVYVDDVFSTTLWDGTGSSHEIETGIDNTRNTLLWTKSRNYANSHRLYTPAVDTAIGYPSLLYADVANSHGSYMSADLSGFTTNGFTVTDEPNASTGAVNSANLDYVAWNFKAAPGFFTIKTWVGDGQGDRYLDHDLGSVPGSVIVKNLTDSQDWGCYHRLLGTGLRTGLALNENYESGNTNIINPIRSTPTASQIHIRGASGEYNTLDEKYVAYIFAHDDQRFGTDEDESIIKCGAFTANYSSGASVDIGWEPQFVIFKSINVSGNWHMQDIMRGMSYGPDSGERLFPNLTDTEGGSFIIGTNSTGFDVKPTFYADNTSVVYIAIRRPHKPITDPTKLFKTLLVAASESGTKKTTGFPVDLSLQRVIRNATGYNATYNRLRGSKGLRTNENADEDGSGSSFEWDFNDGYIQNFSNLDGVSWNFRRAPGFLDVVCYKGTGSSQAIPHNLEAVPELMIVKGITPSNTHDWRVYHKFLGSDAYLELNTDAGDVQDSGATFGTLPTSSNFYVNTNVKSNTLNEDYVAYLFASSPGVSKVGSYQGNNGTSTINIDCGFADTASFVLIKDLDDVGSWYVWDKTRGIVEGVDPMFRLDSDASEMTTSDWIEPLSSGFQIGTSGTTINTSGKTYMFLAIA